MLFNNDEIKKLFYCEKIAERINTYYPTNVNEYKQSNGGIGKESPLFLYDYLKSIIFRIENFLEMKIGNDPGVEKVRLLKETFDNFNFSTEVVDHNIEIYKVKFILRVFISNFYRLINDIFSSTYFLEIIGGEGSLHEADFIVDELHTLNESYGMAFVNNNTENKKLYDRVVLLEDEIKRLHKELNISSAQIKETVDGFVLTQQDYFNDQLNFLIDSLRSSLGSIHNKYESEVKGKVESLETLIDQTDQDFKSTFNDYNQLKGLVNIKGEMLITDHYKKRAFWERITYWAMTIATFIIIILSICLALNGLNEYKEKTDVPVTTLIENYKDQPIEKIEKIYSTAQENALIYLVLRLIFSVLLFSSIIYTSRVAYRAYVHMRHSENMMLKLATLRPFINQLKEDERNQIHKDLVPDYFGKDAGMVDSANEKFKDLPTNVSAVAMKAIEQISGSGSNSSTEKNGKKSEGGTE